MYRNITTENIGLIGTVNNAQVMLRNISSTVGITHTANRIRDLIRIFTENIILSEQLQQIEGIVKYISDTIGFTDVATKFRVLGIGFDTGDYITLSLINLSNFITSTQQDTGDMIRFSAYNSGDMRITDD